jgi:hypothetical protein
MVTGGGGASRRSASLAAVGGPRGDHRRSVFGRELTAENLATLRGRGRRRRQRGTKAVRQESPGGAKGTSGPRGLGLLATVLHLGVTVAS